jgi:hypothetical protein
MYDVGFTDGVLNIVFRSFTIDRPKDPLIEILAMGMWFKSS